MRFLSRRRNGECTPHGPNASAACTASRGLATKNSRIDAVPGIFPSMVRSARGRIPVSPFYSTMEVQYGGNEHLCKSRKCVRLTGQRRGRALATNTVRGDTLGTRKLLRNRWSNKICGFLLVTSVFFWGIKNRSPLFTPHPDFSGRVFYVGP